MTRAIVVRAADPVPGHDLGHAIVRISPTAAITRHL